MVLNCGLLFEHLKLLDCVIVFILLSVLSLLTTAIAQCPTTPPNCANYRNGYFVNNLSNCRAYWYCANANSQPQPDLCPVNFNFDEANQLCNHPSSFPCTEGGSQCPSAPPNCANYRNGYFVNNLSSCRAYWYCANANSQPQPDLCPVNFNFDEANQLCNHPSSFPCTDSGAPTTVAPPVTTSPTTSTTTTRPTTPTTTPTFAPPPVTTPSTIPPTTTPPTGGSFVDTAVREHNRYRAIHSSPNVTAFSDISQFSQQWANFLASTDQFHHSSGSGFGENLYKSFGGSTDLSVHVADAVKWFYDEIRFYDWNNPVFSMDTGHFTQVVWRSSIQIGVGAVSYTDGLSRRSTVVCINYRPPGNYAGQFQENVLRPSSRVSTDSILENLSSTDEEKPSQVMVL